MSLFLFQLISYWSVYQTLDLLKKFEYDVVRDYFNKKNRSEPLAMKSLVLAEKPSVAKEIARVLQCKQQTKTSYEGPNYVVTWALGHLVTLAEPEDYDPRYKTWNLNDLPILPDQMKLKPLRETKRQFRAISDLCKRKDIKELIIATDAGREGELVARWIMELVRWKKPFRRLWISSQTDKAIKEGFAKLRPGRQYDRLYEAALCRAEADWYIGLNLTRALTTKYQEQLAAGRVQTPTLSMIVKREEEIKQFQSKEFYRLQADFGGFSGTWQQTNGQPSGDGRIFVQTEAEALQQRIQGKKGTVTKLSLSDKTEPQPLPYDLTELQRDANRRFQFSAKKTSSVLQKLYESHKLVTYPRTDSRYLSSDMTSTLTERLKSAASGEYASLIHSLMKSSKPIRVPNRVINDSKVTDHHAIIPTEQPLRLANLTADERKLYDLILRRYIALFYPPYRYKEMKAQITVDEEIFHIKGRQVIEVGWKALYGLEESVEGAQDELAFSDNKDVQTNLPPLKQGQTFYVQRCEILQGRTTPPPRYSEAGLLAEMEKHQLGTPATRADIIEKLLSTDTIARQNNRLQPTGKGMQLVQLVSKQLRSPELTAEWERKLEQIAKGKGNKAAFIAGIKQQTIQYVKEVKQSEYKYKPHNITNRHCPDCGQPLKEKKSRRGSKLICINPACNYMRNNEKIITQKRCPQCKKKMELRTGKAGKFFHCRSCNVIEVLDSSSPNAKANLRQTQKLVKKYSSKGDFGSSLGDALKAAMQQQSNDK